MVKFYQPNYYGSLIFGVGLSKFLRFMNIECIRLLQDPYNQKKKRMHLTYSMNSILDVFNVKCDIFTLLSKKGRVDLNYRPLHMQWNTLTTELRPSNLHKFTTIFDLFLMN